MAKRRFISTISSTITMAPVASKHGNLKGPYAFVVEGVFSTSKPGKGKKGIIVHVPDGSTASILRGAEHGKPALVDMTDDLDSSVDEDVEFIGVMTDEEKAAQADLLEKWTKGSKEKVLPTKKDLEALDSSIESDLDLKESKAEKVDSKMEVTKLTGKVAAQMAAVKASAKAAMKAKAAAMEAKEKKEDIKVQLLEQQEENNKVTQPPPAPKKTSHKKTNAPSSKAPSRISSRSTKSKGKGEGKDVAAKFE